MELQDIINFEEEASELDNNLMDLFKKVQDKPNLFRIAEEDRTAELKSECGQANCTQNPWDHLYFDNDIAKCDICNKSFKTIKTLRSIKRSILGRNHTNVNTVTNVLPVSFNVRDIQKLILVKNYSSEHIYK